MPQYGLSDELITAVESDSPDRELLENLVRESPHTSERQERVVHQLASHFRKKNIGEVHLLETRDEDLCEGLAKRHNLIVNIPSKGTADETLALYAHYDVVPPSDDYETVKHDRKYNEVFPTKQGHRTEVLKGLGVEDMLGGICAMEHAARMLVEHEVGWHHRNVRLIMTYGEETYSRGFEAAKREGAFDGVDAVLTPEILVNKKLLAMRKKNRALILGRLGLFNFDVACRGIEEHCGSVTEEDEGRLTSDLFNVAAGIVKRYDLSGHPDDPERIVPKPSMRLVNWGSNSTESLTVPGEASFSVRAHTADPNQLPSSVISDIRSQLDAIAAERFPSGSEEDKQRRSRAFTVTGSHPIGFSKASRESVHHPFVRQMMDIAAKGYKISGGRKGKVNEPDTILAPLVDSGTADCPRIQHDLNIPLVGYPVVGGGAHTAYEWLHWPSVKEVANVFLLAAAHEKLLAPKEWEERG